MNILIFLFISTTIFGLDQYTKMLVTSFITEGQDLSIIDNFLRFVNVKNSGAAFSILQNKRIILILIPSIMIIVGIYLLIKNKNKSKILLTSISFIIGGALGNLIDRIRLGYVVDFIDFNFGSYHYPSFNIADSFITIGAIILLIYIICIEKKTNENNKDNN